MELIAKHAINGAWFSFLIGSFKSALRILPLHSNLTKLIVKSELSILGT